MYQFVCIFNPLPAMKKSVSHLINIDAPPFLYWNYLCINLCAFLNPLPAMKKSVSENVIC